jgi:hypothetical protein
MLGLTTARYVLRLPSVTRLKRAELVREIGAAVQGYLERKAADVPSPREL